LVRRGKKPTVVLVCYGVVYLLSFATFLPVTAGFVHSATGPCTWSRTFFVLNLLFLVALAGLADGLLRNAARTTWSQRNLLVQALAVAAG